MGVFLPRKDGQKGFTLIEIMLVLAIAGAIFVIVFLAVAAANKGKKDTAARSAASRLLASAEQFASNNNGAYPANCGDVDSGGKVFKDQYFYNGGTSSGNFTCEDSNPTNLGESSHLGYTLNGTTVTVCYWAATGDDLNCDIHN